MSQQQMRSMHDPPKAPPTKKLVVESKPELKFPHTYSHRHEIHDPLMQGIKFGGGLMIAFSAFMISWFIVARIYAWMIMSRVQQNLSELSNSIQWNDWQEVE